MMLMHLFIDEEFSVVILFLVMSINNYEIACVVNLKPEMVKIETAEVWLRIRKPRELLSLR